MKSQLWTQYRDTNQAYSWGWPYFCVSFPSFWPFLQLSWPFLPSPETPCTCGSFPRPPPRTCWARRSRPIGGRRWSTADATRCSFLLAEIRSKMPVSRPIITEIHVCRCACLQSNWVFVFICARGYARPFPFVSRFSFSKLVQVNDTKRLFVRKLEFLPKNSVISICPYW